MTVDTMIDKVSKLTKDDEALRTIGEVAEILEIEQYVIRFWESKFSQIHPYKNRGIRYYSKEDISTLMRIKKLLYEDGYTIKGVQQLLTNDILKTRSSTSHRNLDLANSSLVDTDEINIIIKKLVRIREHLKKTL
jgi:DNA-binding transcriptional MerR regulator